MDTSPAIPRNAAIGSANRKSRLPARLDLVQSATGLVLGSFCYDLLQRFAGGVIANGVVAYVLSAGLSTLSVFVFLFLFLLGLFC